MPEPKAQERPLPISQAMPFETQPFRAFQHSPNHPQRRYANVKSSILSKLDFFIRENMKDEGFNSEQLAEKCLMSTRTLYRKVFLSTGVTPAAYIREKRLQYAWSLMEIHVYSTVAEIAYESGFHNADYFGQIFQKRFGIKASEKL
jgi:transcriptional regulator GlxA family with amidase domain